MYSTIGEDVSKVPEVERPGPRYSPLSRFFFYLSENKGHEFKDRRATKRMVQVAGNRSREQYSGREWCE